MGPLGLTVVSSAVAGGVWAATGSPAAEGITLGVVVLIDVDHLYEYCASDRPEIDGVTP